MRYSNEQEFRKEVGIRIRRMMRRKGMSQGDLAAATRISEQTISKYITGKVTPSSYNMNKIAIVLGCTLEDFISDI